ncbi:SCO family protein [Pseudomonas sp. NA-150]|uniref:SCO family protein n=1 Tax=Pseudomonas sp. NA-150 TaxID=3367525 RepID=UPI0037CC797C
MTRFDTSCALTFCLLAGCTGQTTAHSVDENGQADALATHLETAQVKIVDVPLVDQDGKPVRLEKDLVSNKIVVMSFIYTHCTEVCPLVSSIMGKVQTQLGARVGGEVQLVSISIDPLHDDPQRLADYSRDFQHGPGWSWLTGSEQSVNDTLKGLGGWTQDIKDHQPLILVGNGNSTRWTRFYGLTDPGILVSEVEKLSGERIHARHTAIALESQP